MKKILTFLCLLLFCLSYSFSSAQSETIDQLKKQVNAQQGRDKLKTLNKLSELLIVKDQALQAKRFVMEAIDLSRSLPCLLYTSPSPRDATLSRMPSSA